MESIYFEKNIWFEQEGMMCAQHCLNMLLQQRLFTAIDLAEIAKKIDAEEAAVMERKGESANYDDSGYFSIQVLQNALKSFALTLTPFGSPAAAAVAADPNVAPAFILNYQSHWFTVRKLGGRQWFNLNSMLPGPDLISDTYLALFLKQLQTEKYSIFVVSGELPRCDADEAIRRNPVSKAQSGGEAGHSWGLGRRLAESGDQEMAAALEMSREDVPMSQEDRELQAALAASLQTHAPPPQDPREAVRSQRLAFLDRLESKPK